jgi:hypothetical protein
MNLGRRRWIASNPVVHASVEQRLGDKSLGYAPSNLPAEHLISGDVEKVEVPVGVTLKTAPNP